MAIPREPLAMTLDGQNICAILSATHILDPYNVLEK
jgi:hypothetical protein